MRKTFKYRLFPTAAQRTALLRALDACRWVYNTALEVRRDAWDINRETLTRFDTIKLIPGWKAEQPFLNNAFSQSLQEACTRVDLAFQAFFRRVKAGEKPGYPRFKGRGWYDSFTYPQYGNGVKLDGNRLTLSKIGAVKIKLHRPLEGTPKTVIIRRDSVGNWYACFSCEVDAAPLPPSPEVVGVDLGLKTFAMLSTGDSIPRQRWMKRDAADIARLQRKKEQFAKGSPERRKVLRALNRAYQRAANRRADFAHQESRKLVNRFGLIVFENLDIQDMQSNGNRVINRGIADVAWGQFVQFTTYKAESAGRAVLRVNPRGTTQECSGCGAVVPKDLSVRVHDCPYCGLKLDRDLNASLNILARGLASLDSGPRSPRL
ncbi:MAG: putative transposase [bacterium ADurb.Bin429]|jgi:putative transposase|nr:MAG: putative transposase [bacterium ADurb.Bin429]